MATTTNIYKARLINANPGISEIVTFDVSPELSENRTVNYTPLEPIHSPGQIFIYKNTTSRTFELSDVKFISRSLVEATTNIARLQLVRSWTLPWFGAGASGGGGGGNGGGGTLSVSKEAPAGPYDDNIAGIEVKMDELRARGKELQRGSDSINAIVGNEDAKIAGLEAILRESKSSFEDAKRLKSARDTLLSNNYSKSETGSSKSATMDKVARSSAAGYGIENLGAPPAVLLFSAYSSDKSGGYTNIRKVPVVITNLSINYPTDVDWIPTAYNEPFPTIMSISISLQETHAPIEFTSFNLASYKQGILERF